MTSDCTKKFRRIGWNGIRLTVPGSWETHVRGRNHLIFEENFSPLLEIRWQEYKQKANQKANQKAKQNSRSILKRMGKTVSSLHEKKLLSQYSFLKEKFHVTGFGKPDTIFFDGAVCICKYCQTLILLQFSNQKRRTVPILADCLRSLCCPCTTDEMGLWSIQDFRLLMPTEYSLIDYSIAPGLTRISFRNGPIFLHTCKLAPANTRLSNQSLSQIIQTLSAISNLETKLSGDGKICTADRTPSIGRQLILRMKREKPFVRARISHHVASNRLMAIVLQSIRPIPAELPESITNNYEFIQV